SASAPCATPEGSAAGCSEHGRLERDGLLPLGTDPCGRQKQHAKGQAAEAGTDVHALNPASLGPSQEVPELQALACQRRPAGARSWRLSLPKTQRVALLWGKTGSSDSQRLYQVSLTPRTHLSIECSPWSTAKQWQALHERGLKGGNMKSTLFLS